VSVAYEIMAAEDEERREWFRYISRAVLDATDGPLPPRLFDLVMSWELEALR
jgi:hypothetical protein